MAEEEREIRAPFLKWPGGKRWLVPHLMGLCKNRNRGRYIEPFFGGGALFFAVRPRPAVIADVNMDLVRCLQAVQRAPSDVLLRLRRFENTKDCYYKVRDSRPTSDVGIAARLIYLIRTGWGGIYRLNRHGLFNVPYGDSGRAFYRPEEILMASSALQGARIRCNDFEHTIAQARSGDFIYADPPYAVSNPAREMFGRYTVTPFDWTDHLRLAECLRSAADRGVSVVVSGAWSETLNDLYRGWWVQKIKRYSLVASQSKHRRRIHEAVISSFPVASASGRWIAGSDRQSNALAHRQGWLSHRSMSAYV
jgi:DNA adenine methylase